MSAAVGGWLVIRGFNGKLVAPYHRCLFTQFLDVVFSKVSAADLVAVGDELVGLGLAHGD
jgi:hypothetical protein